MNLISLDIVLDDAINSEMKNLEYENKIMKHQLDLIRDRAKAQNYVYKKLIDDNFYDYSDETDLKKDFKLAFDLRSEETIWHRGFYTAMERFTELCFNITSEYKNNDMMLDEIIDDLVSSYYKIYIGYVDVRSIKEDIQEINMKHFHENIRPLCITLKRSPDEVFLKLKPLIKENEDMKLRLNTILDVGENAENWYYNLFLFARNDNIDNDYILDKFPGEREEMMYELNNIIDDHTGYTYGFNAGMLASTRMYTELASYHDIKYLQEVVENHFHNMDENIDTFEALDGLNNSTLDYFPFLDT